MLNKKKMRDLVPNETKIRSQQHKSWTTNDEDEDTINEEIRNQQKRLRSYLQIQQQQQQHNQQTNYDSNNDQFYLNENESRKTNRLNHDRQSLNLNKDSSSENEFYLSQPHQSNNPQLNSDGSETSSTVSFAKLSKIKNSSIPQNLNQVDSPSLNVVYSSDQDDHYLNSKYGSTKHGSTKKRNSITLKQQMNQDQQLNHQSNGANSEQEEAEIANQILQLHMKLEEKKKQIELEKQQVESYYKAQKRDISNEAFLKALKIEKMMNNSANQDKNLESLNSLRKKSDQYYVDANSSINIMSSSVIDLEKDLNKLEADKILIKQQKLDQLVDQQLKQRSNGVQKSNSNQLSNSQLPNLDNNNSKFYLHTDKSNDNQLNSLINYKLGKLNLQQQNDYHQSTEDYLDNKSLNQKLMIDSLNSMHSEMNSSLRRSSLQSTVVDKNLDNLILNNNNDEKGFFIPFDSGVTKSSRPKPPILNNHNKKNETDIKSIIQQDAVGFVIGHDLIDPDPKSEFAKAKKKEFIMNQSMKRKAEQEEKLRVIKDEMNKKCEEERKRREQTEKRKEENRLRREAILEQHRLRKLQEDAEKEGGTISKLIDSKSSTLRNRHNLSNLNRARPKSIHISPTVNSSNTQDLTNFTSLDFRSKLVSDHLDAALVSNNYSNSSLLSSNNFSSPFANSLRPQSSLSTNSIAMKKFYSNNSSKHNLPSLPPFMLGSNRLHKGSGSSDGVSEIGSTYSEYTGPKLYVKPVQKSNKGIIVNAVNVVLGGAVNGTTKKKVLEEINNNDSKHFLILFRGTGMQFRAIYTYNPDVEEVVKLYGTGPKIINNEMIDKFYKYNSGSKNFNEVHTKHLTVTIDAVTIHSQLWMGKRMVSTKKDALLI